MQKRNFTGDSISSEILSSVNQKDSILKRCIEPNSMASEFTPATEQWRATKNLHLLLSAAVEVMASDGMNTNQGRYWDSWCKMQVKPLPP